MKLTQVQIYKIKALVKKTFKAEKELGKLVTSIDDQVSFNNWIAIPPFGGDFNSDPVAYLGRIVQVRHRAGEFGTDVIFLRLLDHRLITWENQFYRVMESDFILSHLARWKCEPFALDSEQRMYSAVGRELTKAQGFIVF